MRITKRQLRKIIIEEKNRLLTEQDSSMIANNLLDQMMTSLEDKLYKKYPEEEVEEFAVDMMNRIARDVETLLVKLIDGGYREKY